MESELAPVVFAPLLDAFFLVHRMAASQLALDWLADIFSTKQGLRESGSLGVWDKVDKVR